MGKKTVKNTVKYVENCIKTSKLFCDLPIVIDVANVVYNNKGCLFSRLKAVLHFLDGFNCVIPIASAAIRHRIDNREIFEEHVRNDVIYQTPAGEDDDMYILDIAHQTGAIIISNDRYKEYRNFYSDEIDRTAGFIIMPNEDETVVSIPFLEILRAKMSNKQHPIKDFIS